MDYKDELYHGKQITRIVKPTKVGEEKKVIERNSSKTKKNEISNNSITLIIVLIILAILTAFICFYVIPRY